MAVLCSPGSQLVGVLDPATGVYVPRGVSRQSAGLVPPISVRNLPMGQTPDVLLVLPLVQKCPARHGPVQSRLVCPRVTPNRPALHGSGTEVLCKHA
eukprot:3533173-Prymnesium_polylepis.1